MKHKSKPDWCVFAGIALAAAALFLHVEGWIAGPVLLILLLCAYPQSYELAAGELIIHDSLTRRRIPYHEIRGVRTEDKRVRITYGSGSEILVAPKDAGAFVEEVEALMPRDRYVEYAFPRAGGVFRVS